MQRTRTGILVGAALVVVVLVAACGGGGAAKQDQAKAEEWAWLTETKQTLDSKRQELVDLSAQAEAAAVAATEEVAETTEELAEGVEEAVEAIDYDAKLKEVGEEVEALTEEFSNRLVGFINADPMIEGEEPTESQVNALRMKSSEDIVLAREWIVKGGDYKRAIEIINTAMMFDADNPELEATLAEFEANRYMSEEKFAAAEKGMTEADVRRVLGQVNLHNVREYPDKEVVAWFYPTAEDGSAAAVWFQPEKDTGILKAYQIKYQAIDPSQMAEEQ
jgi:hypothetical protein